MSDPKTKPSKDDGREAKEKAALPTKKEQERSAEEYRQQYDATQCGPGDD